MKSFHWFGLAAVSVAVIIVGVALMLLIAGDGGTAIFDAETGDCFVLPIEDGDVTIDTIEVVGCNEPHDAEIVATGLLNPDRDEPFPSAEQRIAMVDARCPSVDAFAERGFGVVPVVPNETSWSGQRGAYACVAITVDGSLVDTGLIAP